MLQHHGLDAAMAGVVPSFSRPHVSNDIRTSESLFRTLKYTPAYPRLRSPTSALGDGSSASSAGITANIATVRSARDTR